MICTNSYYQMVFRTAAVQSVIVCCSVVLDVRKQQQSAELVDSSQVQLMTPTANQNYELALLTSHRKLAEQHQLDTEILKRNPFVNHKEHAHQSIQQKIHFRPTILSLPFSSQLEMNIVRKASEKIKSSIKVNKNYNNVELKQLFIGLSR